MCAMTPFANVNWAIVEDCHWFAGVELGHLAEREDGLGAGEPADDVAAVRAPVEEGAALAAVGGPVVGAEAGAAGLAAPRLDHADVADLAGVDHLLARAAAPPSAA